MRTICVTGSRDYQNWKLLFDSLNNIITEYKYIAIKFGDCETGADLYADMFAYAHRVQHVKYIAEWDILGKKAGPIRNHRMIDSGIDEVLAFPLDSSKGTLDCCSYAHKKGVPVTFPEMRTGAVRSSWWDWAEIISN